MRAHYNAISELFESGTSTVQWCEDVVSMADDPTEVTEFWNTVSNLAYVVVGFYGLYQCGLYSLPRAQIKAEIVMILIGIGSGFFHAYKSRAAQISDELPMSILAALVLRCFEDSFPLTQKPQHKNLVYGISEATTTLFWLFYLSTAIYETFLLCCIFQVCLGLYVSWYCGSYLNVSKTYWFAGLCTALLAQAVWSLERYRYHAGLCDAPMTLCLHPLWHLGTALAHRWNMAYCRDIVLSRRRRGGTNYKILV